MDRKQQENFRIALLSEELASAFFFSFFFLGSQFEIVCNRAAVAP